MKTTIGRKPKRKAIIYHIMLSAFLATFILGACAEVIQVITGESINMMITYDGIHFVRENPDLYAKAVTICIIGYFITLIFLILFSLEDYLASIQYWEIDNDRINFVFSGFRFSLIKEIPSAFIHRTLNPTMTILIQDIEAISIDARFHYYGGVPIKEPFIHLIFCLKDGSTISMFAGDGKYHQEMIQAIQIFREKNIQLLDPYHLLDEPEKIYEKIGEYLWEK